MFAYLEGIIILMCINSIAAMGVSLLTGFTGIFTLGHAAYMAIGGYTTAILTMRHGLHWLPAVIAGGLLATAIAYLIGIPTLKLMGDYFAIASIGLGETVRLIIENWEPVTRGARGFPGIESFTTLPVALTFFVILTLILSNILRSNYGRAFKACRDDYLAASLLGFNTARYRVISLCISAFYCGIAGGLFAGFMTFLQPTMFDLLKSTELTAVVVFGGLGSLSGTILGTGIITVVTEFFRPISQYRMLIYGAVLVLVMVFRPEGLMGEKEFLSIFKRRGEAWKNS
ncbi:MAG: branched-chain amino acid ABC transporter permease [Synergistetes bacterium]|nr:MAG: Amino acid/amide ABC transporter membrane protein 2, HAAT family [bacterium 42_11]MBC7331256.1 branched-chain amino acid ABC transporter permease [Synergistota bacterium]MDK2871556.1 branched-chain amino acid transport system permease protein [bacterium]